MENKLYGKLYIVATPIGNMEDITIRALKVLESVDIVAAEDSRKAQKLFNHYEIKNKIISFYEHNEDKVQKNIVTFLKKGLSVAIISSAGTPCISDPGFKLVRDAREEKIEVIPIPGASALISAISVCGIPINNFSFIGFLNKKKEKRKKEIENLKDEEKSMIFYESPVRIVTLIENLIEIIGDRKAFLAREITKKFEEFFYGKLSEILESLKEKERIKGEFTLIVQGKKRTFTIEEIESLLKKAIKTKKKRTDIASEFSNKYNISKNIIYKKLLEF